MNDSPQPESDAGVTDDSLATEPPNKSDHHRRSLRRLGRDTIVYGGAMLLARVASFALLPLYTRYLTPADYGLLAMLDLSMEVVLLLVSAGATAGLMRFYFKAEGVQEKNQVIFTAWASTTLLYLAGTVVLVSLAPFIWRHLLSGAGTVNMVRLAAVNFTLSSLMLVPNQMLYIDQRSMASSMVLLGKVLLQVGLNILFVVVLRAGPIGVLWGTFGSALVIGLIMTVALLRRTGVAWSWSAFRDLRRFSIPIQLSKVATFFVAFGDRFFLEKLRGLATVGLYGLAYQFGFLISDLLGRSFFQAWTPQRFQLVHEERSVRDAAYNRGFLYGNVVIVSGAVGISLFIRPVLDVMTTPKFHAAAAYVPILVLAYVFQVWSLAVDFGIEVSEKTKYTSIAAWISAAVIAVLYLLLIPQFGGIGAALATLGAMMVRFGATLYFAQRLWPVSYEWGPHLRMLVGGVAVTAGAFLVPTRGFLSLAIVAALGFVAYGLWVWVGVLHPAERTALTALAKSPRSFPDLLRAPSASAT